jgi:hypothetical protein
VVRKHLQRLPVVRRHDGTVGKRLQDLEPKRVIRVEREERPPSPSVIEQVSGSDPVGPEANVGGDVEDVPSRCVVLIRDIEPIRAPNVAPNEPVAAE